MGISWERGRPARMLSLISGERGRPARILSLITWERGRPARMLLLMVVAELPRGFAGSHYVGSNHNGQAEGEPGRRCRSIQVEEMPKGVPVIVRAGRPRSQEMPSTTHKTGNMVYIMPRNRARSVVQRSRITPPMRGSRREGGARSRAGGGQTRRPVSDCQRHGQRCVGGGSDALVPAAWRSFHNHAQHVPGVSPGFELSRECGGST